MDKKFKNISTAEGSLKFLGFENLGLEILLDLSLHLSKAIRFCVYVISFFSMMGLTSMAQAQKNDVWMGFVQVRPNKELYVEYTKPRSGKPTVVLLHGLTYTTFQWDRFAAGLVRQGIGVVNFDFDGMGQTLLKQAPVLQIIPYEQQVQDTLQVLKSLQVSPPFNLVGLSYGGGIGIHFAATFPRLVGNLVLMAPFTEPLQSQDQWIKAQIWATKQMFPWNAASDDELYDYFLRQIIYATYPQAEPIVLENPFKLEAIFRLVQGIRKFNASVDAPALPRRSVHLMVAAQDQYIPRKVMDDFWNEVPEKSRASRIIIYGADHKIPESVPLFSSAWVAKLLTRESSFVSGETFEGFPLSGEAKSESETIKVDQ
jgi:pimeloyl-ACP methyl ester carboxylesterase